MSSLGLTQSWLKLVAPIGVVACYSSGLRR